MIQITNIANHDKVEIQTRLAQSWGSTKIVTRGKIHDALRLPGYKALLERDLAGLVIYHCEDNQCEIVVLESFVEKRGVASRLIQAVVEKAKEEALKRVWLITTNDNLQALGFYQRRGFRLVKFYPNALEAARILKPEIPLIGYNQIPLRDELELELVLP